MTGKVELTDDHKNHSWLGIFNPTYNPNPVPHLLQAADNLKDIYNIVEGGY